MLKRCVVRMLCSAVTCFENRMLQMNRKLPTMSTSDPRDPSVVFDRKCAHCGSPNCDSNQIVPFGDTPACNTAEKVSMWCSFYCDAADELQTCYLLLGILFERDLAALGRWRASPLLSHFSKNGSSRACDPHPAMHSRFLCMIFRKPF